MFLSESCSCRFFDDTVFEYYIYYFEIISYLFGWNFDLEITLLLAFLGTIENPASQDV